MLFTVDDSRKFFPWIYFLLSQQQQKIKHEAMLLGYPFTFIPSVILEQTIIHQNKLMAGN